MNANRIVWLSPSDPPDAFPDVGNALKEPDGLLAAGGDLSSKRLLAAYSSGIFPWYDDGQPILWWSPDPRCVLRPDELHVSRRLQQQIRGSTAQLRFNQAFGDVIRACAGDRKSQQGTWITEDMIVAYEQLHADGWAHSIEVWEDGDLTGGLYGLCIGKVFFGESMFSARANSSKMALLGLTEHMQHHDLELIDCQVVSQHLVTLGACVIPRAEFTQILDQACAPPTRHDDWPQSPVPVVEMLLN
ncbi:MAG: leucyl/phenylalanyl-tRNA--protein transferase [Gammaproteobacteria bacterium]|nr:leucyl/phenylalanyl-tRNA--protein transferase [Gammaproteobacteria bacterium]